MIRIEIIANQSTQEEIIENLEEVIPGFLYTIIPLANGRGKTSYKLGTVTWPETNFILIAYADDRVEKTVKHVIRYIKLKFPSEGIKLFIMHDSNN
jgi:hypothetical protein